MTLHVFVNPLVVWIWVGGAIVALGAVFAIWPDRRRPSRSRPAPAAGAVTARARDATAGSVRWLLSRSCCVPIGWLLFTGLRPRSAEIPSPLIGRPAARVDARRPWTAGRFSSADLAGRPYVVNVWASWCAPCVDEHPVLTGTHEELGDELAMVGILYQDTTGRCAAPSWPGTATTAGRPVVDEGGRLAIDLGVTGPPETFFVDADGIVRAKQFGPLNEALDGRAPGRDRGSHR